ncbi:MAG: hypothetical protein HOW73_42925 [Polyangiaceae bacterium]|nr:hypothetical protein [Polyangiaceae bacterium]
MTLRFLRSLVLAAGSVAVFGCGPSIVDVDDDDGGGEGPEPTAKPPCPGQPPLAPEHVTAHFLFDHALQASWKDDEAEWFAVFEVHEDQWATRAAERPDLSSYVGDVRIDDRYYADIKDQRLQIFDAADPLVPVEVTSLALGGVIDAYGYEDGYLYTCFRPVGPSESRPHRIDLRDPQNPGKPELVADRPCVETDNAIEIAGSVLIDRRLSDVALYDLTNDAAVIANHGWAPDGVHAYGYATSVHSDGDVTVVQLENEDYVFLYYRSGQVVYSSFGVGAYALLDVDDGIAYVLASRDDGQHVIGFDVRDSEKGAVEVSDAVLEAAEGDWIQLVARDRGRLFLSSFDNHWLVPAQTTGTVPPFRFYSETDQCPY